MPPVHLVRICLQNGIALGFSDKEDQPTLSRCFAKRENACFREKKKVGPSVRIYLMPTNKNWMYPIWCVCVAVRLSIPCVAVRLSIPCVCSCKVKHTVCVCSCKVKHTALYANVLPIVNIFKNDLYISWHFDWLFCWHFDLLFCWHFDWLFC